MTDKDKDMTDNDKIKINDKDKGKKGNETNGELYEGVRGEVT